MGEKSKIKITERLTRKLDDLVLCEYLSNGRKIKRGFGPKPWLKFLASNVGMVTSLMRETHRLMCAWTASHAMKRTSRISFEATDMKKKNERCTRKMNSLVRRLRLWQHKTETLVEWCVFFDIAIKDRSDRNEIIDRLEAHDWSSPA